MILRNEKGHFKKGLSGNPGGTTKKSVLFKKALMDAVTIEDIQEVVAKLIEDSKSDDFEIRDASRKQLLDRVIGKAVIHQISNINTGVASGMSLADKLELAGKLLKQQEHEKANGV